MMKILVILKAIQNKNDFKKPMGGNISKQIVDLTEKAVISTSLEFSQETATQVQNTQEIVIDGVEGDISIDEINLKQQIEVDVKQSMGTLSNTNTQTKLTDKILQETKQVVSGISLLQANYAEKNINKIVETLQSFSSSVAQRCAATAQQSQLVKIKGVKGSLHLNKLLLSQISGLASQCVQDAALANTSFTEIESTLSQKTDQFLEGINPLAFLGMIALGLVGLPLTLGGVLFTFLGPLLLCLGSGLIIWTVTQKKVKTELKLYSGLYQSTENQVDVTNNFYTDNTEPSLNQIVHAFETHATYAFDLDRCNKKVYMYTDPAIVSQTLQVQDLVPNPNLVTEESKMRNGDFFYEKTSGNLYTKCNGEKKFIHTLTPNKTYQLDGMRLKDSTTNVPVTGIQWPNLINVSGWKKTEINHPILFSGVAALLVGLVLVLVHKKSPNVGVAVATPRR